MSGHTSNLSLPYIMAAQAQKHVTHNEALRSLDALVQISVEDRDLSTPPSSPVDGVRYIVGPQPTDEWQSFEGQIAAFQDGTWTFFSPQVGWKAWVVDENKIVIFKGPGWEEFEGGLGIDAMADGTVTQLGVNAAADAANRLSVNSDSVLLNHNGSDIQTKLNKKTASDTASVLFQTDFSGRAEFGLTGDDDFHVKVSPDGTNFNEAIVVNKADGSVSLPNTSGSRLRVHEVASGTEYAIATSSYQAIGLEMTINPASLTSKFLITTSLFISHANYYTGFVRMLINGTSSFINTSTTSAQQDAYIGFRGDHTTYQPSLITHTGLHEPNSLSPVTIKLEAKTGSTSRPTYINRPISAIGVDNNKAESRTTVLKII